MKEFYVASMMLGGMLWIFILGLQSCNSTLPPTQPPGMVKAYWRPMEPPRAGLRCWYSSLPTYGVSYCEQDPSATFGAGN